MIDAHTATRTFREIQRDIRIFLESWKDLFASDQPYLIEFKWSDGSIDVFPHIPTLQLLFRPALASVWVGGVELKPRIGSSTASVLNIIGTLCATIPEFKGYNGSVAIQDSTIRSLSASNIQFALNVRIKPNRIDHIDNAITNALGCNLLDYKGGPLSVPNVKVAGILEPHIRVDYNHTFKGQSELLQNRDNYKGVRPVIELTGPVSLTSSPQDSARKKRGRIGVFEDISVKGYTKFEVFEDSIETTRLDFRNSSIGKLLLYPKFYVSYIYDSTNNRYVYTFNMYMPTDNDYNTVVTVHNVSSNGIKACNVWKVDTTNGLRSPIDISGLNYIEIPPYSAIDFLYTFHKPNSDVYEIHMLPMKSLKEV